jgi:hypothetical protein
MYTKSRCALAALASCALIGFAAPAAAQVQRSFPQNTLRGSMVFGEYPNVTLNGRATQLSPGSRVRDQRNMIVMAASLTGQRLLVHYTLDIGSAQVRDVWVLRPDEAAIKPWPTTIEEAQTWTYDPTTASWVKP